MKGQTPSSSDDQELTNQDNEEQTGGGGGEEKTPVTPSQPCIAGDGNEKILNTPPQPRATSDDKEKIFSAPLQPHSGDDEEKAFNTPLQPPVTGDDDEEKIFGTPPQPRVNVSATQNSLQFYLARARKILRLQDRCTVGGLGQAIGLVVEVVEALKREKIAEVERVETSMAEGTAVRTRFRKPKIEVILKRGEYAELVSDYRRRKVIEIFESYDQEMSGVLSVEKILEMDLPAVFYSSTRIKSINDNGENIYDIDRVRLSKEFLQDHISLSLPDFIRYASILINPLLLESRFKEGIEKLRPQDALQTTTETKKDD